MVPGRLLALSTPPEGSHRALPAERWLTEGDPASVLLNARDFLPVKQKTPWIMSRHSRLLHRKNVRESWRMDRKHREAVRDMSNLVLPGIGVAGPAAGAGRGRGAVAGADPADSGAAPRAGAPPNAGMAGAHAKTGMAEGADADADVDLAAETGTTTRAEAAAVEAAEVAAEAAAAEQRWTALTRSLRAADTARDGTVSPRALVTVLREQELDLGEEATLELLRRYDAGGRCDYISFLRNIRRLLFPHGAPPRGAAASGRHAAGRAAPGARRGGREQGGGVVERGALEGPELLEPFLKNARGKGAVVWLRARIRRAEVARALAEQAGAGAGAGAGGDALEGRLVLQRLAGSLLAELREEEHDALLARFAAARAGGAGTGAGDWSAFVAQFVLDCDAAAPPAQPRGPAGGGAAGRARAGLRAAARQPPPQPPRAGRTGGRLAPLEQGAPGAGHSGRLAPFWDAGRGRRRAALPGCAPLSPPRGRAGARSVPLPAPAAWSLEPLVVGATSPPLAGWRAGRASVAPGLEA